MDDDESFLDKKRVSSSVYHSADDLDVEAHEMQDRRPRTVLRVRDRKRAHGVPIDRGDPDSHLVHHTFLVFVSQEQSLYFQDGERSVDFIIAWDNRTAAANSDVAERRRAFYEGQLAEELHLESDDAEEGCALSFVKIHVPKDVLKKYAEILKVRMPMKEVRRHRALLYFLQSNLFQAKNQHNNLVT